MCYNPPLWESNTLRYWFGVISHQLCFYFIQMRMTAQGVGQWRNRPYTFPNALQSSFWPVYFCRSIQPLTGISNHMLLRPSTLILGKCISETQFRCSSSHGRSSLLTVPLSQKPFPRPALQPLPAVPLLYFFLYIRLGARG